MLNLTSVSHRKNHEQPVDRENEIPKDDAWKAWALWRDRIAADVLAWDPVYGWLPKL